jgi:hypothetical protein
LLALLLVVLGGVLLVVSCISVSLQRQRTVRRHAAIQREQLLFENRLRQLTQLAVSAMRAEVRRQGRDA